MNEIPMACNYTNPETYKDDMIAYLKNRLNELSDRIRLLATCDRMDDDIRFLLLEESESVDQMLEKIW